MRYYNSPNIRVLKWDKSSILYFIDKKIAILDPKFSLGDDRHLKNNAYVNGMTSALKEVLGDLGRDRFSYGQLVKSERQVNEKWGISSHLFTVHGKTVFSVIPELKTIKPHFFPKIKNLIFHSKEVHTFYTRV